MVTLKYIRLQVYMRGLPFDASAQQIEEFFAPLRCLEIKVRPWKKGLSELIRF